MKIGIQSGSYIGRYGIDEGLRRMKKHGYEAVDFQDFIDTEKELFRISEADFEKTVLGFRAAYEEAGIEIAQAHGPWRWPVHDYSPEERAERFEKMAKSIRGTALLGCRNFVIHPIMPFGDIQDPEPERLWEMNYEFMTRLCEVGRENQVIICLENMPMTKLALSRPSEILKFVRTMNTPWMRICLDTGHCAIFGESPAQAVRDIGKEYLQTLHIHDNNGRGDFHWIPYTGIIDWADFTAALLEVGFDGVASLETGVPRGIPADLREYEEIGLVRLIQCIAGRANQ